MSNSFLILILYYSYITCSHWGKLGDIYTEPLCTVFVTSCEKYSYFKINSTGMPGWHPRHLTHQMSDFSTGHEKSKGPGIEP